MTIQDQEQIRSAWNQLAPGFDKFVTPQNISLAEDALRLAGLRPGMRFLDVASGSGALSIPAARQGAKVLAVDLAPVMVDRLIARAHEEGLSNLEGRVMDGHALELEDDAFDIAGSQHGVSLFPNLQRGLREMVRVTRPGGRVLIIAAGSPRKTEFLGIFLSAMQAKIPDFTGLSMDPPPLPFQVAAPEKLRQEMADAGLVDIHVETATWEMEFESGVQMWNMVTNSNPIGAMLIADLTDEQKSAIQATLGRMLDEHSEGSGLAVLHNEVNIGIGTK